MESDQSSSSGDHKNVNKTEQKQVDNGPCLRPKRLSSKVIDYSDPFSVSDMIQALDAGKFGSVTKEMEEIADLKLEFMKHCILRYPSLANTLSEADKNQMSLENQEDVESVINLDDDDSKKALGVVPSSSEIANIDSDDEDTENQRPKHPFQSSLVQQQINEGDMPEITDLRLKFMKHSIRDMSQFAFDEVVLGKRKDMDSAIRTTVSSQDGKIKKEKVLPIENDLVPDKGVYVGVEDDETDNESEVEDEDLGNLWSEMAMAECSKGVAEETSNKEPVVEDCDHDYVLQEDMGSVCLVCGLINKSILDIIDV